MGIYKRKQESKKTRKKERKQELDQESDQEKKKVSFSRLFMRMSDWIREAWLELLDQVLAKLDNISLKAGGREGAGGLN